MFPRAYYHNKQNMRMLECDSAGRHFHVVGDFAFMIINNNYVTRFLTTGGAS